MRFCGPYMQGLLIHVFSCLNLVREHKTNVRINFHQHQKMSESAKGCRRAPSHARIFELARLVDAMPKSTSGAFLLHPVLPSTCTTCCQRMQ
jgi:hypothetical protein